MWMPRTAKPSWKLTVLLMPGSRRRECIIRFKLPSQKEQQYERMALRRIQDKTPVADHLWLWAEYHRPKMAEDKFARPTNINDPKSYGSST